MTFTHTLPFFALLALHHNAGAEITVPNPPDVSNHPNLRLLPESICGPIAESDTIGTDTTRVLEFPWMALLAYDRKKPTRDHLCGGTIINKRYVLTAAHCVTDLPSGYNFVSVRLGEHNQSTERDCDYGVDGVEEICTTGYRDYGVERVHFHPDFSKEKLQNDVALVRLDADVDFSLLNIKPICLPIGEEATFAGNVTATGWGVTNQGVRSPVLLKVHLPQVSLEECQNVYQSRGKQIWYKQMCAGGIKGKGTCSGDAGGPLQSRGLYKDQIRYIQRGIISYGAANCRTEGFPDVNTRVVYYLDWILDTMAE